jgi:hypothetical protein
MAIPNTAHFGVPRPEHMSGAPLADTAKGDSTAVSWSAIFAGAAGAAALSLLLLMLGVGLGLSSTSPWARDGIAQAAMGTTAIAWVMFSQVVASGMGGYLAGRLRTRWVEVQRDEVHFRDTAHGFLAWAVAALVTATMLTQAAGVTAPPSEPTRTAASNPTVLMTELDQRFMLTLRGETGSLRSMGRAGQLPQQQDQAAERKASTDSALWVFVALLSGAFVASLAATLGGRQRDA